MQIPKAPQRSPRGITLIELIIVLAIAAGIAVTLLRAGKSMDVFPARAEIMNFAGAIKSSYDRSILTGLRYEIVLDLDENKYSLECTDKSSIVYRNLNETASQKAFRERNEQDPFARTTEQADGKKKRKTQKELRQEQEDRKTDASPNMATCDDQVVKSHNFDRGVTFDRARTSRMKDPVKSGKVRIAVFPNGTMEPAVIWLTRGEKTCTVLVHEMTGNVEVVTGDERRIQSLFEVVEER